MEPRGNTFLSDVNIVNSLNVIVSLYSTTAWSMRCHRITPEKRRGGKLKVEDESDVIVYLPALHKKGSALFDKLIGSYPNNHLERSTFYTVAKRVTQTQQMRLRAVDYNSIDLLYEPQRRLMGIICDLYGESQKEDSNKLQNQIDEIYTVEQNQFLKLIGSTKIPPHNISFAVGDDSSDHDEGTCLTGQLILWVSKEWLPNTIDAKIKTYYLDIVEHSLDKVVICILHALCCRAQQLQINALQEIHFENSYGNTW